MMLFLDDKAVMDRDRRNALLQKVPQHSQGNLTVRILQFSPDLVGLAAMRMNGAMIAPEGLVVVLCGPWAVSNAVAVL